MLYGYGLWTFHTAFQAFGFAFILIFVKLITLPQVVEFKSYPLKCSSLIVSAFLYIFCFLYFILKTLFMFNFAKAEWVNVLLFIIWRNFCVNTGTYFCCFHCVFKSIAFYCFPKPLKCFKNLCLQRFYSTVQLKFEKRCKKDKFNL